MDLKLFFDAIPEQLSEGITSANSVFKQIKTNLHQMPDYKSADLALIGLTEHRGAAEQEGVAEAANGIRQELYRLKKGLGAYHIADLGNLRSGHDLESTHDRLREVCQLLLEHNTLPVLIGGTHDLTYGQYQAYEHMEKLISVLNVDAYLDMEEQSEAAWEDKHLNKLLLHEPNYLFNYSHLAYQSYLIDRKAIEVIEKLYFEAYRIGHLRQHIQDMEPIIRDADMLSFDLNAIKSADAPGGTRPQPFGLTGEEACQICWYAGLNEKLSSAGFYSYNPDHDDAMGKTAQVAATMVWYFIEGYHHRRDEQNFRDNDYLRFVVSMPAEPETLVFYKSRLTDKWWMEVPYPAGKARFARNCIVPCAYSDYEKAGQGEVPERWINTHAKLI